MEKQATVMNAAKTPTHLWIVGVVSLLWNAFGGYNYTMTQLRDPAFLAGTPQAVIDAIDAAPVWATAAWAIGVWSSLLGSILFLLRSRYAGPAFLASFVGAAVSFAWQYSVDIVGSPILPAVILGAVLLQWWYADRQGKAGVLH